ncbi:hypothetical protein A3D23_02485 [candidate division WOR-1 bacterium RIFCSPHIGHO2_02_FULL_53_26]|nr:MAG: hypothetical protein A3D23_02485 [candidate division WOR-1 bacterium RIFCSPHIGHO2_02_FULL_53_26]
MTIRKFGIGILFGFCYLSFGFSALAQANLGARPMGMGGAFTGLADDVNAIFINPAGIASVQNESVLVSTRLSEGREYTMIGGVEQTGFGSLGLAYVGTTDPAGNSSDKFTTQTLYVSLAQSVNQRIRIPRSLGVLSLGINVKFASRKVGAANGLYSDAGSDVNIDLASVFKPNDNISLGLSLLNGKNERALLSGVSSKLFNDRLILSLDGGGLGFEWRAVRGLSVRGGRGADKSSAGFGFNLGNFNLDYAFTAGTEPVHYWSVSIVPGETQTIAEKGDKLASVFSVYQ